MNWLKEIKEFFNLQEINRLSTGQIALWHALMYINNKCAWTEWFTVANSTLQSETGLTRDGIYKARNVLKQKGYIDFKETGPSKPSRYKMLSLVDCIQDSIHHCIQDSIQDSIQSCIPLNKLNETKHKQNNKEKNNKKEIEDFFEKLWKLYPKKQGKGSVSDTQKEKLYKIGYEELERAVNRYIKYIADNSVEEKYIKQGSTFFNSGYVDYLDSNFKGEEEPEIDYPVYKREGFKEHYDSLSESEKRWI